MKKSEKEELLSKIDRRKELTQQRMNGVFKNDPIYIRWQGELEGIRSVREIVELIQCEEE